MHAGMSSKRQNWMCRCHLTCKEVGQHDRMICMMLELALTGIQGKPSHLTEKTWTAFCHSYHAYHAAASPVVA